MPLPLGEPHYAVAIKADKLKPGVRYKSGWDSRTDKRSPYKTRAGREKIVRSPGKVEVFGTLIRSHINPEIIDTSMPVITIAELQINHDAMMFNISSFCRF